MKIRLISFYTLCALLIFSCSDKNTFQLSGTVSNPGNLKTIYLLTVDSTQISVVDSTKLSEDGEFKFKHNAPYANLYKLRIGGSIFDLIAKNGDQISFSTNLKDDSHAYTITGSAESDKIKEFNKLSNYYTDRNTKLSDQYEAKAQAMGKQSDSLIKAFRVLSQKIISDYSDATLKFVNENKNTLAGFFAATTLDADKYEQQLVAYADEIKYKFPDNAGVRQFVKQMMLVKPVSVGHIAPDFTVLSIDNKPVKLSDYRGKYLILDFWASWCGPCRQENPNVVKQYAIYHPKGLNILGISLDTSRTSWQAAIASDKLSWTQASEMKDFYGPTETSYHIEAIPSNFIIDPSGVIIAKNQRGTDLEEFLKRIFNKPQ